MSSKKCPQESSAWLVSCLRVPPSFTHEISKSEIISVQTAVAGRVAKLCRMVVRRRGRSGPEFDARKWKSQIYSRKIRDGWRPQLQGVRGTWSLPTPEAAKLSFFTYGFLFASMLRSPLGFPGLLRRGPQIGALESALPGQYRIFLLPFF